MFLPGPSQSITLQTPRHSVTSYRLFELWSPPSRKAQPILKHPLLVDNCPGLIEIGDEVLGHIQEARPASEVSYPLEKKRLLVALRELHRQLAQPSLPARFMFAPYVTERSPMPTYSRRRLPTGQMEAAFDTCYINRNWDGLERIDDLTMRDTFEDMEGFIRIVRVPLVHYLGGEIERWLMVLESTLEDHVALCWRRDGESQDALILEVLEVAERWRQYEELPGYLPEALQQGEEMLAKMIDARGDATHVISAIGAYLSELMRAQWGGVYRRTSGETKGATKVPAMSLHLPFGAIVNPIEKVMQAYEQKRKISLQLHLDVIDAHRRQGTLQGQLGRYISSGDILTRKAAVRILCTIADVRVEDMLIAHLSHEEQPDILLRMLDRLLEGYRKIPEDLLAPLVEHEQDSIASRAIMLLLRQKAKSLPKMLQTLLEGGERFALRPLARVVLEKLRTKEAKKVLRGLGPIPLRKEGVPVLIGTTTPSSRLPVLADVLEDSANPMTQTRAIEIFCLFPDREEEEMLGAALADPARHIRLAVVGLLSQSDHPTARQLLRGRLMFEEDPMVRDVLKEAVSEVG
ncbi:MAG TPA: hypothetical protein DCE42_03280 [Myxococcales bacterium]|nr:hypothetical protein [Deltaproteobacteria bacterium]MBU54523.1 hypothetical protein [Deltaproteobacteria bacterium]HAA53746.1 hypothetical protein [Myxococcales bacterium]